MAAPGVRKGIPGKEGLQMTAGEVRKNAWKGEVWAVGTARAKAQMPEIIYRSQAFFISLVLVVVLGCDQTYRQAERIVLFCLFGLWASFWFSHTRFGIPCGPSIWFMNRMNRRGRWPCPMG